jgi:hypothetical protein
MLHVMLQKKDVPFTPVSQFANKGSKVRKPLATTYNAQQVNMVLCMDTAGNSCVLNFKRDGSFGTSTNVIMG